MTATKLRTLYTSLVRPILEYGSIVWNPWLKSDIKALDKVQRRCEKMCVEELKLEPLTDRRKRTDLVETYKFINKQYKTNPEKLFSQPDRALRGHSQKLFKQRTKSEVASNFFTHRVVDPWNKLPESTVAVQTVNRFKRSLRVPPQSKGD